MPFMGESINVYTQHGRRAGRIAQAGELQAGEYYLHTIAILQDRNGQYLLQQRSMQKRHRPGAWDVTGGGVQAGEDGLEAAIREIEEELGLTFLPEQFLFGGRIPLGENGILDMWGVSADFTAEDCVLRAGEVDAVRLVDYSTFRETVKENKSSLFMALMDDLHERMEGGQA